MEQRTSLHGRREQRQDLQTHIEQLNPTELACFAEHLIEHGSLKQGDMAMIGGIADTQASVAEKLGDMATADLYRTVSRTMCVFLLRESDYPGKEYLSHQDPFERLYIEDVESYYKIVHAELNHDA